MYVESGMLFFENLFVQYVMDDYYFTLLLVLYYVHTTLSSRVDTRFHLIISIFLVVRRL